MAIDTTVLSETQRRVLTAVKRRGEVTADELAEMLGISASAVRQHLGVLRSAGLVEAEKRRGQPGRPVDRYHATAQTEPLFETTDSDVSIELLADIEAEDPAIVDRVFERRRRRQADTARAELAGRPMGERVEIVTALLDAQGFIADHERIDDRHHRINLRNCPIWTVATRFPQACGAELDLLRELLPDATVTRRSHKTAGAHTCAYDITTS